MRLLSTITSAEIQSYFPEQRKEKEKGSVRKAVKHISTGNQLN